MWFVNNKIKLIKSGLLNNMTDTHGHILWGVDDGSVSLEQTKEIILKMQFLGIKRAFITPHIMTAYPQNTLCKLTEAFNSRLLPLAVSLGFEVKLAAEYMLDEMFFNKLRNVELLTYDGRHILIEMSLIVSPINLEEMISDICSSGHIPVLAHPERYCFLSSEQYARIKYLGCKFQLNLLSLSDYYGKQVRDSAEYLLDSSMYEFVGTDVHSLSMLNYAKKIIIKKQQVYKVQNLINNNDLLFKAECGLF